MKITTPEITLTLTPYELHLLKAACYLVAEVCNTSIKRNEMQGKLSLYLHNIKECADASSLYDSICSVDLDY